MKPIYSIIAIICFSLCVLCPLTYAEVQVDEENVLPTIDYKLDLSKVFVDTPSEKDVRFIEWMVAGGSRETGAAKFVSDGLGGITMIYGKNVTRSTALFSIDHNNMMYTSSEHFLPETIQALRIFREHCRLPGEVAEDFELTEMSLIVSFERHNPKSFWAPYLLKIFDPLCPAFYQEKHVKALEYPWLNPYLDYFLSDAAANLALLKKIEAFQAISWDTIDYDFKWGLSTVLQRAFSWGPDKRREYVLVPMLDMINHRQNNRNNYFYTDKPLVVENGKIPIDFSMVMGADAEYKEGTEVFISYSKTSNNIQLLLQYGFTLDNDNDRIVVVIAKDASKVGISTHRLKRCSIDKEGRIATSFLRLVSSLLGFDDVVVDSFEYIRDAIQKELDTFTTTLEEDEVLIKNPEDRMMWSAYSYRIQAKKVMQAVLKKIDKQIEQFNAGIFSEFEPKNPRFEWPLRMIVINPTKEQPGKPKEDL